MTTSLTRSLAEFTVALDFDDLPAEAVNVARSAILDCIGCILAGTHDEAVDIFERVAVTDGGNPAATAFGRRRRLPVSQAAFINGLAGHVLDLDDTSPPLIGHPSVPLVPAIFAVAESTGASGMGGDRRLCRRLRCRGATRPADEPVALRPGAGRHLHARHRRQPLRARSCWDSTSSEPGTPWASPLRVLPDCARTSARW
ncbi:MAG: MmgE/PrpD family protein [Gammaproteobacteria bacterium]|nr:MmgE/PrpD family protein [Gammaproteobacteria bacterium]